MLNKLRKQVEEARKRTQGNKNLLILEEDTTNDVRLVPNKELGNDQFKNIFLHYKQGKIVPKTMFSPKTYGEPDAVEAYVSKILSEGRVDIDMFKMLKNMEPTEAFITTAVLRGKEKDGTKLWVLSVAQAEALADLVEATWQPETPPDISDPEKGYDIRVKVVSRDKSENKQKQVKFTTLKPAPTPLVEDKELLKKLLEDQPSWEDAYPRATNEMLQGFIESYESDDDPEDNDEDENLDENEKEKDTISQEEEDARLQKALKEFAEGDEGEGEEDEEEDDTPF